MKTGRRGVEPTKKGEDPKKPKAQQEVKVTAKKADEPPQKRYYTQEEYDKSEAIKARNKAAKEQYQSDLENYNKAMKLYNEGASYDVSSEPLSLVNKSGITTKGKKTTFTAAEGGTSAKKMNEDYERAIKSGEYVDINDPRISEKNRYYLKGTMLSSESMNSNQFGTVKSRAIPASVAFEKDLNWKKLYGEDFDPYEWQKAAKGGKFDEYVNKKGYSGKGFMPTYGGWFEKYGKAEKPIEPTYEKEQNIGLEKVIPNKMPLLKANKIDQPKGKLIGGPVEKGDWEGPAGGTKYRTKYSLPQTTSRGNKTLGGFAVNLARFVKEEARGIGKPKVLTHGLNKTQGKARLIQGKTGREEQMAKAYFGAGYGNKPISTINESKAELQGKKKELKTRIRANEGDVMTQQARKAELKDVKAGIKQANLAAKYLKKYDRTSEGVNINAGVNKYGGKIKTFTGQAMAGFEESKQNTYDPNANRNALRQKQMDAFKSSTDNAANKNTIINQQNSLSFKEKVQQDREARKSAPSFSERRKEKKASQALQKSIKIPGQ